MPVRDSITIRKSNLEKVTELFTGKILNASSATVIKSRTKKEVKSKTLSVEPGEDSKDVARLAAEQLYAEACIDAGDKKLWYTFSILGPGRGDSMILLGSVSVLIKPNDDEDGEGDGDDADEKPTAVKESAKLIGDVGRQYVQLLELTQRSLALVAPVNEQQERISAAEWNAKVEMERMRLADAADNRGKQATAAWWEGFSDLLESQAENITKICTGFAAFGVLALAKAEEIRANTKKQGR